MVQPEPMSAPITAYVPEIGILNMTAIVMKMKVEKQTESMIGLVVFISFIVIIGLLSILFANFSLIACQYLKTVNKGNSRRIFNPLFNPESRWLYLFFFVLVTVGLLSVYIYVIVYLNLSYYK